MCEDCGDDRHDPANQGLMPEDLEDQVEYEDEDAPTYEEIYGSEDQEYFEEPEGEEVSIPGPLIKRRWGFQLPTNTGDCRVWHRDTMEPMRAWRKHLYKKTGAVPDVQLKCRRCGHNPDDIPF